jgi:hypothetical protein
MNDFFSKLRASNVQLSAALTVVVAAIIIGCGGGGGGGGGGGTPVTTGSTTTGTTTTTTSTTGTTTTGTTTTGTTTTGTTTSGSLPQNAILFGQYEAPVGSNPSTTYDVENLSPTTKSVSVYQKAVPDTTQLFVQNPNTKNQFVFAANAGDNQNSSVGIYSNSSLTTVGAKTLAPPVYAQVISLSLTQNGNYIVFTAFDQANNVSSLYSMTSSGGNLTLLDSSFGSAVSPADSDTIVYSNSSSSNVYQLFKRSIKAGASGTATQITTDSIGDKFSPAFSHDGTMVAYQYSNINTFVSNVSVITLSTGTVVNLPTDSTYIPYAEAFSGDGSSLAIVADNAAQTTEEIISQPVSSSGSPSVLYANTNINSGAGVYWTTSGGRIAGGGGLLGACIRRALSNSKFVHPPTAVQPSAALSARTKGARR